jgi:hypothetical protein
MVTKGDTFTHKTKIHPDYRPAPGQTWRGGPKAECVVTAVRNGAVYYAYAGETRGMAYMTIERYEAQYG